MTYVFSCPVYTLGIQLSAGSLALHAVRVFVPGLLRFVFLLVISHLILHNGAEQACDLTDLLFT